MRLKTKGLFLRIVYFLITIATISGTIYCLVNDAARYLPLYYITIGHLILGAMVYGYNPKNKINIAYAFLVFFTGGMVFFSAIFFNAQQPGLIFLGAKFIYVNTFLLMVALFYFSNFFPFEKPKLSLFHNFLVAVPGIILSVLTLFSESVVKDVAFKFWGREVIFGHAFPLFALYCAIFVGYTFAILIYKYKISYGLQRTQIAYIFISFLIIGVPNFGANIILPIFFQNHKFVEFALYFALPEAILAAYAVLRHHLMSIEIVIQKGAIYTFASIVIIGLYALGVYLSEQFLRTTFGYTSVFATAFLVFIIAALFQPLLRLLQDITDKIFLRHKYDYQRALRNLSRDILKTIRLEEIAGLIVSVFVDIMKISEISFLTYNRKKERFVSASLSSFPAGGQYKKFELNPRENLVQFLLNKKRMLIIDELEEEILRQEPENRGAEALKKVLKEAKQFGFKLWIPVISKDELLAVIALGQKLSEDIFTIEDMRILNTLANQTAMALENVGLYQEVLETKNYNQEILDTLVFGVLTTDENGLIISCNPAMGKIIGAAPSEIINHLYTEIFLEKNPLNVSIASTMKNKCFYNFEASLLAKKRGLIPIMINTTLLGTPEERTGVLVSVRDLSEIKELENRARQADKLKALGIMSSGMAHEIKNPLSSLRVLSQLLPIKYEDPAFRKKLLEIVPAEIGRIDRIVESLLRFARTTKMKFSTVSINDYLENILKDYLRQAEENHVKIVKNYAELPQIMIDPDQFFQVFSNLFLNGIQAMPEGGTLTVSTKVGKQTEGIVQGVTIEISDTGHGISEENLKNLFDPFFTTKHGGTGLGLTIAHSIVEAHRGEIKVSSKLGEGTAFHIYLPLQQ